MTTCDMLKDEAFESFCRMAKEVTDTRSEACAMIRTYLSACRPNWAVGQRELSAIVRGL